MKKTYITDVNGDGNYNSLGREYDFDDEDEY